MKKVLKLSAAAAVALSAITPVAAFAAETTSVKPGIYTTDATKGFTSIDEFKKLSLKEKAALLQVKDAVLVLGTEVIPASVILTGTNDDLANSRVSVEKYQEDNNVILDSEVGIKPGEVTSELKVTAVSAIDETGVEVTFAALEEALKDVTVEVKNSKNEVVAVLAQDLAKGAKSAYFDFEKNVTAADLTGVWTVEGLEYNFTEFKSVSDIVDAADTDNLVKLALALTDAKITGADEDLVQAYADAISAANAKVELTKLSEVQSIVDQINKDVASVKTLVETIEAGSPVKIYNALNENLKRVDSNLVADYLAATAELKDETSKAVSALTVAADVTNLELSSLQSVVDRVNGQEAYVAYQNASDTMTAANITAAEQAIAKYDDGTDVYKFLKDQVQELKLVRAVLDADKATTLKKAINNLVSYDADMAAKYKDAKDIEYVTPALAEQTLVIHNDIKTVLFKDVTILDANVISTDATVATYAKELKTEVSADVKNVNSTKDVRDAIVAVNSARATGLYVAIEEATSQADLLTALKASGLKQVAESNKEVYFPTSGANQFDSVPTDAAAMQAKLDTLNIKAVEDATTNTAVIAALNVFGIDNVVTANAAAYIADFTGVSAGATNADTVKAVKEKVAEINIAQSALAEVKKVNEATTATEVKAALDELAIASYVDVADADKLYIAEQVLKVRNELAANRDELNESGSAVNSGVAIVANAKTFANVADLTGHLDKAVDGIIAVYGDFVDEFAGSVTTPSTLVTSFGKLGHEGFDALTNAQKATVAQQFIANYPTKDIAGTPTKQDYKTLAAVKAALDTIIAGL